MAIASYSFPIPPFADPFPSSHFSPFPWCIGILCADRRPLVSKQKTCWRTSSSSKRTNSEQVEAISQKKLPLRAKDGRARLPPDGSKVEKGRSSSTAFKSRVLQKKDNKRSLHDLNDEQVDDIEDFEDASFLNAVVKVYCTHTAPDFSLPWQKRRQYTSTGSAFMIKGKKLLTNAHCVEDSTQVKVKRRGDDTKFVAKVLAIGAECDIALLSVESEEFWRGVKPLRFGRLPRLQDSVTVVGYPLGGETISVTQGVVSRIEITSYSQGGADLLGIQIDAAINPGNSGGPAFNDHGDCIGVAFQVYRSEDVENIGYVIPTTVVKHFLDDYEMNGDYTGFPCLGVLLQKLENPVLREFLKVPSDEGVLVRNIEPTADVRNVLKKGDVIVSFDGVRVGCEGTVPFRSTERIAFRYLISQRFSGDVTELGIIRDGKYMEVHTVLNTPVHLVPYNIEEQQPSYLIIAGVVFTPLSEPLIAEEDNSIGLQLLAKARFCLPRFKGEEIVIASQVLVNEVNVGYEDINNQQVLKFNGTAIRNMRHLAYLFDKCKDKYLVFEFEDNFLAVLERKSAVAAGPHILKDYGIPSDRSPDLIAPYLDSFEENPAMDDKAFGEPPAAHIEIGCEGLIWV